MSLSATNAYSGPFTPNGATTAFPFTFKAMATTELQVVRISSAGATTTLSSSLYTVSLLVGDGGTVTFTAAPAAGDPLYVVSNPAFAQQIDFANQGAFLPATVNQVNDRASTRDIYLNARLSRASLVPLGEAGLSLPSVATRASQLFAFDAGGAPSMLPVASFKGDTGQAASDIGLFSAASAAIIPATINMVQTSGLTAIGTYPARYIRDPDQTLYTTIGSALITAVTAEGAGVIAAAQAAITAILNRVRFLSANGGVSAPSAYFVIEDTTQEVHAGHFGAVADMTYLESTGVVSGTDSQPAIQAMIDWRVYLKGPSTPSGKKECLLPPGMFRSNSVIQLGYGETYRKVVLRGGGNSYAIGIGGTTLAFTDPAQPGIVIQSGRYSSIQGMTLLSGGRAWLLNNNIGLSPDMGAKAAGFDDRYMSAFFDPAQPLRSPRRRYAPHAAIAVDPYIGATPNPTVNAWAATTAYTFGTQVTLASKLYICTAAGTSGATGPAGTADWIKDGTVWWHYVGPSGLAQSYTSPAVAAFLPVATRIGYGKANYSSDFPIQNVLVLGFAVGLITQPSGGDGNGDFVGLDSFSTQYTPVSVSICQTQARSNTMHRVSVNVLHTFITGLMHGKQAGRIAGVWNDVAVGSIQQIFETYAQSGYGGIVAHDFYAEGIQRIGTIIGGGSTTNSIIFTGEDITFQHEDGNGKRGVPLTLLGSPSSANPTACPITFDGVALRNFKGCLSLDTNVIMRNAAVSSIEAFGGTATNQAQARFWNTTAGGLMLPFLSKGLGDQQINYLGGNETTLASTACVSNRRNTKTSRDLPASLFTPTLSPTNGGTEEIVNIQVPGGYAMGATQGYFSASSLSGRTLTLVTSQTNASLISLQIVPGSAIWMTNGQRYYITGRTGAGPYTFTATLLNGYSYDNGGVISYENGAPDFTASSTITGYFQAGGVFTPNYPLFANFAAASANLTSLDRGDGYSGHITTTSPVAAGDSLCVDQYADSPLAATQIVSSVTAGAYPAAIITLNFPAGLTATKRRIPLWVRGS